MIQAKGENKGLDKSEVLHPVSSWQYLICIPLKEKQEAFWFKIKQRNFFPYITLLNLALSDIRQQVWNIQRQSNSLQYQSLFSSFANQFHSDLKLILNWHNAIVIKHPMKMKLLTSKTVSLSVKIKNIPTLQIDNNLMKKGHLFALHESQKGRHKFSLCLPFWLSCKPKLCLPFWISHKPNLCLPFQFQHKPNLCLPFWLSHRPNPCLPFSISCKPIYVYLSVVY